MTTKEFKEQTKSITMSDGKQIFYDQIEDLKIETEWNSPDKWCKHVEIFKVIAVVNGEDYKIKGFLNKMEAENFLQDIQRKILTIKDNIRTFPNEGIEFITPKEKDKKVAMFHGRNGDFNKSLENLYNSKNVVDIKYNSVIQSDSTVIHTILVIYTEKE